jgi:hypothetical protein
LRGSDWQAAPESGGARGARSAQERAVAERCDARAPMARALDTPAPQLRRAVERVCFNEDGLEAL